MLAPAATIGLLFRCRPAARERTAVAVARVDVVHSER